MAICFQLIFYYRNRLILNGRTQVTGLDKTFLRAEGYSRRCRYSEFVAAKRHLNPKRTANCGLHFLEIPKYTKSPKKRIRDMTKMERWLAYFANQLIRL